jgi:DNA-directed RNA polymerase specialized sigma subunit
MSIQVSSRWTDEEDRIRQRLRSYRALVSKHAACSELYESLYPRTTPRMTDDPIGGQSDMFELERVVDQRMDLRTIMDRSLRDMRDEIGAIMEMLRHLPPDEYTVMLRRYTIAETWEDIAQEMMYCERQVRRIHDRAVTRIRTDRRASHDDPIVQEVE